MIKIEIYWTDLNRSAQEEIAKQLGKTPEEIEKESNWDIYPMTEIHLEEEC